MSRSLKLLAVLLALVGMGTMRARSSMAGEPAYADAQTADAAEHLREAIKVARQTDPELAVILEQELTQLELGAYDPSEVTNIDVAHATPAADALFHEPIFSGPTGVVSDQLEHDPRLLDLRAQYESGALTEEEVQVRMMAILKEHGMAVDASEGDGMAPEAGGELPPETLELMDHLLHEPSSQLPPNAMEPMDGMDEVVDAELDDASLDELRAMEPPITESHAMTSETASQ